jgi:glucosamine--fructose-6-phosphate aminotransferase (isomerizing)
VAAHLLGRAIETAPSLMAAMRATVSQLEGAFTLVALDTEQPDRIVAARRNSPLVVGVGQGENFLASDVASFIAYTKEAIALGQDQVVEITPDGVTVETFDGQPAEIKPYTIHWDLSAAEKSGYDWFMRKEIFEQPKAAADTLLGRIDADGALHLDEMRIAPGLLRLIDKIIIVACGTAYHAGLIAKYAIEHWTRLPCEVEIASEFRYRDPIVTRTTLVVTISQSGETADTLMAIRHAREQHAPVVAICNTNGSSIPRESDAVIYTHAGPEIGVASTKGFTTQILACYLLGLYLAQELQVKYGDEIAALVAELAALPEKMERVLGGLDAVGELARDLVATPSVLFIGRHVGYPIALEGALKLKEISYLHAEGFAAGELKHGPIALIEPGLPVFAIVPPQGRDQLHDKVISNIQEVRARGAKTVVIAEEGDLEAEPYADHLIRLPVVPTLFQPLLAIIPLQYFACEVATLKGYDVDQPRNLAKSVTVE